VEEITTIIMFPVYVNGVLDRKETRKANKRSYRSLSKLMRGTRYSKKVVDGAIIYTNTKR